MQTSKSFTSDNKIQRILTKYGESHFLNIFEEAMESLFQLTNTFVVI